MDKNLKNIYIKFVNFLAEILGENYEIVLHDISEEGSKIVAIKNSHISGRSINSPMTGFALELIQSKRYLECDYLTNYKATTRLNLGISGSTFFIKNGDKLEGMLCINYDGSKYAKIVNEILSLGNINPFLDPKMFMEDAVEQLSDSIDEIIENILSIKSSDTKDLKPKQKSQCISKLYEKGIFNIKNAIPAVAKYLNLSEPSVYRYLQKIQTSKNL
ncbi:helix-turn-helix transcriptional regulator [Campylobacter sputorum]|uniref:helix-turn-helix transcriptional regulator n=1 Tax=Campylobacter sputorum TaxID=206 RepID=UPI000B798AD3|nr:PAS domain-containing protein [Campylobacter sputorum]ASM35960.1 PAS domain-containing transcriptional regulator, YheO family [Campylobacter sputorum bv. faecalis CCUG 20703]